jgi:DMSO/TMAO reductase YedYZ molybdopterin-dependent catalytic subunit
MQSHQSSSMSAAQAVARWAAAVLVGGALTVVVRAADPVGVRLDGQVQRPQTYSAAQLAAMDPARQLTVTTIRRVGEREISSAVRGVRLRALLEQAGLAERDRFDWRKAVVVATARDGYRTVFSWPELFNTEGGSQVLLVYERDAQPLAAAEGPIALVAAGDIRTGPRHVRALDRIEVRILRE